MDQERLDTIARTLAAGSPRRGVLRLLAGGALASVGLARVAAGTNAKSGQACCAEKRKRCNQLCHDQSKRLDNADFTCESDSCGPETVILCHCV
jgi:hypothetical protein